MKPKPGRVRMSRRFKAGLGGSCVRLGSATERGTLLERLDMLAQGIRQGGVVLGEGEGQGPLGCVNCLGELPALGISGGQGVENGRIFFSRKPGQLPGQRQRLGAVADGRLG